jgi:dihydropteroate synthase
MTDIPDLIKQLEETHPHMPERMLVRLCKQAAKALEKLDREVADFIDERAENTYAWIEERANYEAEIERLRGLLREGADDLEAYVNDEWKYREDYPHQMKKWERDMDIVKRMRGDD